MPVKSLAAISLEKWLSKQQAIEIVRPHVRNLLVIYLGIIEQCDHDQLIDSLKGIFESFKEEVKPFVEELLQKMVSIILNMNKKKESNTVKSTDYDFCQINAFETLNTLLLSDSCSENAEKRFLLLQPLMGESLNTYDIELLSETIKLTNVILFKCPPQ